MKWKRKSKRIEIERSKPVFTNPESLAEYIQERFDGFYLIGIDGTSGVGKSCLTKQLSNIYQPYEIIDTDDEKYLNQNKGIDYTKYVKFENIKETVFKCQSNNIPVIINGICLLEIMVRLPFELDLSVYYKKMNPDGKYYLSLPKTQSKQKYGYQYLISNHHQKPFPAPQNQQSPPISTFSWLTYKNDIW